MAKVFQLEQRKLDGVMTEPTNTTGSDLWKGTEGDVTTFNRQGRTTTKLNEINELFVEYAAQARKPVLDIGCAFGIVSLEALERGAEVIANDLDQEHLERLIAGTPIGEIERLTTISGRFPTDFDLPGGSLSAVHASNVLHFLSGEEIDAGAKKIFDWLEPGGKAFTISATPYAGNIQGFIQTYEARRAARLRWPGECEKISSFSNDPTIDELPDFMNLLDEEVLARSFQSAGFQIEESRFFSRRDTPDYIRFDGRENVRMVSIKPGNG